MTVRYLIGDTRTIIPTLDDRSIDLVLTSPPFLALRSYLPTDHPDKAAEMGSEATPGEFIDALLDVIELLAPKLAAHGSMCIELGDTYSGSGGAGGDYAEDGLREGQPRFDGSQSRAYGTGAAPRPPRINRAGLASNGGRASRLDDVAAGLTQHRPRGGPGQRDDVPGWPLAKSLCLIPELFRVALVYGLNPLTGRTTPRWRARNVIRWCRPNPPVGALGDKFRPATSEMVVICKSDRRYFDLDSVRVANDRAAEVCTNGARQKAPERFGERETNDVRIQNPAGAPPLDWWKIPTHGYPGAHYATWPEALLVTPIKAMCPQRVCRTCGKPSKRIVALTEWDHKEHPLEREGIQRGGLGTHGDRRADNLTLGWSDCGHDDWRAGLICDPFGGSGTTGVVANGHGRDALLIDLDRRNAWLAADRLGMFLHVDTPEVAL